MSWQSVRNRVVDSPDSMAARYRRRRWEILQAQFPGIADMAVIDLGGRAETWRRAPISPRSVCVVNLETPDADPPAGVTVEYGDACDMPAHISSRSFDIVFSNAVLEHVGGHTNRSAFARTVRSLADKHWIQTPYRYFPIEPHWLFPLFQHLPMASRARISMHWPLVHTPPTSHREALRAVMEVELLSRTELRSYFPDSQILNERVGPLIKSIIAVRA